MKISIKIIINILEKKNKTIYSSSSEFRFTKQDKKQKTNN